MLTELTWLDELIGSMVPQPGPGAADGPERVRVHELVSAVTDAVGATTPVRVTVDLAPAVAAMSRVSLWRAVRNLLINAVEAAGPAGEVVVSVRSDDDEVVVTIDDDGPGLHADEDAVARRRGLRIVRGLLRDTGGHLELGTNPRGGCRARLRIPSAVSLDAPSPA